jgi:hypothetical protein
MSEETNSPRSLDLSRQDEDDGAKNELEKLKEVNTQQGDEIERLKEQLELQNTSTQSLTVAPDTQTKTQGVKPCGVAGSVCCNRRRRRPRHLTAAALCMNICVSDVPTSNANYEFLVLSF